MAGGTARKQACFSCRQRKRKCDGNRPYCSNCVRWHANCEYPNSAPATSLPNGDTRGSSEVPNSIEESGLLTGFGYGTQGWAAGLNSDLFSHSFLDQAYYLPKEAFTQPYIPLDGPNGISNGSSTDSSFLTGSNGQGLDANVVKGDMYLYNSPATDKNTPALSDGSDANQISLDHVNVRGRDHSVEPFIAESTTLPSQQTTQELIYIFFEQFNPMLPCLHQKTFLEEFVYDERLGQSDALIWAILSVCAKAHPDAAIHKHSHTWLIEARRRFDEAIQNLTAPTRNLQAAVWILYQTFGRAEISEMWVFLGKACRLAGLLGYDRLDSNRAPSPYAPPAKNFLEKEERRKTMWALFYLDKALSCLCGWALAINDWQFMVNFPVDDDDFQKSTVETLPMLDSEHFTTCLSTLLAPMPSGTSNSRKPKNLIFKTAVLLGRIIDLHNDLHPHKDEQQRLHRFADLENALTRLCLVAPQVDRYSLQTPSREFDFTIWLHFQLHTCTMLLYHPTSAIGPEKNSRHGQLSSGDSPGFVRCVNATHRALQMIKAASSISMQSLTCPFLMPTYFLCCRFLAIGWLETQDQAIRNDIDLILLILDRVAEMHNGLANKYRKSILDDLSRSADETQQMRIGTGSYLARGCAARKYED